MVRSEQDIVEIVESNRIPQLNVGGTRIHEKTNLSVTQLTSSCNNKKGIV